MFDGPRVRGIYDVFDIQSHIDVFLSIIPCPGLANFSHQIFVHENIAKDSVIRNALSFRLILSK